MRTTSLSEPARSGTVGFVAFTVPGAPVPKGRPRTFTRGEVTRTITPQRTRDYEATIKDRAHAALFLLRDKGQWPTSADMRVHIEAYMPTRRRVDVDNIAKAALDAMNGAVYDDDAQVSRLTVQRHYDPKHPRLCVCVEAVT